MKPEVSTYQLLALSLACDIPENREKLLQQFRSGTINWKLFNAIASNHLVLQSLYPLYKKNDLLNSLPPDFAEHLENIHELNVVRNQKILEQASRISGILNKNGIDHVFLKGVALLKMGVFEDPGIRIMEDIDILVSETDWIKSSELLMDHGYSPKDQNRTYQFNSRKHFPRLYNKNETAAVEIHQMVLRKKSSSKFPPSLIFKNSAPVGKEKSFKTIKREYALLHCIFHSMVDHRAFKTAHIRLRELQDVYILARDKNSLSPAVINYPCFRKQKNALLKLTEKLFNTRFAAGRKKSLSTRFFLLHHSLNLRFRPILVGSLFLTRFPKKFYTHYLKVPLIAIFNKKIRKHFLHSLFSKKSWNRHFASWKNIMR